MKEAKHEPRERNGNQVQLKLQGCYEARALKIGIKNEMSPMCF
jgi:hypothetical protein